MIARCASPRGTAEGSAARLAQMISASRIRSPPDIQAHRLSHRRRYPAGMIPLDLLIALVPTIVLFALWVLDDEAR